MKLKWENFDSIYNRPGEFDVIARTKIGFYQVHINSLGYGHWWTSLMDANNLEISWNCTDIEDGKRQCQNHFDTILTSLV